MLFSDLFDTELAQERYWQGSREVWNWRGGGGEGEEGGGGRRNFYTQRFSVNARMLSHSDEQ